MPLEVRGKTVVLTGTFKRLKRAAAEAKLAELGAKIGGSVGKSTHILFAGEKAGGKIDAAARLGVAVHGEDELMALLAGETRAAASGFGAIDPSLSGPALAEVIAALPWDHFEADRDLPPLRAALYAHEAAHGVTRAHQEATARLRPGALLGHAHGHDIEVEWSDLSPDGRFFATGSWVGDDYERGGVLQIWDVAAGRCVNRLRIRGGVGWPDYDGCLQWRPDGRRVGLAFDTNGVGSFDPFAKTGDPESCAYVTDGWSRPPGWTWSPNSRDVYIACWGPDLALGAIVPMVGRRPAPRWCASAGTADPNDPDSEPRLQPPRDVTWAHPDRIVGTNKRSELFALDANTGAIVWEQKAYPPVSFSPDGSEFAMHPAGIVYYDAATGLPNGKLPMHLGAESLLYSRDGARLAAVVQPGNRWGAEPGVFIYDRGEYRYCPDSPALAAGEQVHFAWHPDGSKAAITAAGRLQIWSLGEKPELLLDLPRPGGGAVAYGDGVLISHTSFGLCFMRERDGAVIGEFAPAIEASGESPLESADGDAGAMWGWNPAFPLDRERVAVALPEGVVIGSGSVAEIDGKIAWVVDRKWAWPWRWGETKVWPDPAAACADPAAPIALKRKYGKKARAPKAKAKQGEWPAAGGSLDDIAGAMVEWLAPLADGFVDVRHKYAVRTMTLGLFDRAAAALDDGAGWRPWPDPWTSAFARGETVLTALTGRIAGAPALTDEQTATLRRWLEEAESLLRRKEAVTRPLCAPRAVIGAAWIALGEVEDGEALLTAALREKNLDQFRGVVAEALSAIGRTREAIEHLTSSEESPSWVHIDPAIGAITSRGSAADLRHLMERLKQREAHGNFVLLDRGIARLIELRAWDDALWWIGAVEGISTRKVELQVAAAMVAAGEPQRAEAMLAARLRPVHGDCSEYLLELARMLPEAAQRHLAEIHAAAPRMIESIWSVGEFLRNLAGAAALLGRLDVAAAVEQLASDRAQAHEVRLGVLAALEPAHPEWAAWFSRARAGAPGMPQDHQQLAALAFRGGLTQAHDELLDAAIEAARGQSSPDIQLDRLAEVMVAAGDLAGAHRAWMAVPKGRRAHRNGPLMAACEARGLWGAALELLRQMPTDVNGSAQRASKLLVNAAGKEGL